MPVASAQGLEAGGLVQSLGVPLVNGYPLPAVLVTDKEDKVRYFATFQPGVKRSVEETLRVVASVKEVDQANGKLFTPANWVLGEPTMTNSKTGVVQFYKERHGEGEPEEDKKEFQRDARRFLDVTRGMAECTWKPEDHRWLSRRNKTLLQQTAKGRKQLERFRDAPLLMDGRVDKVTGEVGANRMNQMELEKLSAKTWWITMILFIFGVFT